MTTKTTSKKVKKLPVKKVTIKDLGVKSAKTDAIKGGANTAYCGASVRSADCG